MSSEEAGAVLDAIRAGLATVVVEPFGEVAARLRAGAEAQAQRLAVFPGGELELTWA
jgi:hypothetical protein